MSKALARLRPAFIAVGYTPELLEDGRSESASVPWYVGYSQLPQIARNACVVAIEKSPAEIVEKVLLESGAPLALVIEGDTVTIWKGSSARASVERELPTKAFEDVTDEARELLDPRSIHRAKTLGRFDRQYQLDFVDIGFLPHVEKEQGEALQRILEQVVAVLRPAKETLTDTESHEVLTIAFWLMAARMLRDHKVPGFANLKADGEATLAAVARHYSGAVPGLASRPAWLPRINEAAKMTWEFSDDFKRIGPEAIDYIYENSLIADQTRKDLGTHSTPPFIVEYVLGRLRSAILTIPAERRVVIEPACGHGAFLVAALRLLAEGIPSGFKKHDHLRDRLRGLEIDHAAKEMARLSLTLADIPNADGWNLVEGNMFVGNNLVDLARGGTILLANPPFEDFSTEERAKLSKKDSSVLSNKTAEMLRRVLPALEPDAVFGVVVPRTFLSAEGSRELRRYILKSFQLLEICVFPDKVFNFSSLECALVLARGSATGTHPKQPVVFRRVREAGMDKFRECSEVSVEERIPGSVFLEAQGANFELPELRRLWTTRNWQTLSDIATVQQGLSYHGRLQEGGHETVRDYEFEGSTRGIVGPAQSGDLLLTDELRSVYMDITTKNVMRFRGGLPTGEPQVVLNYHPHSRGPWRLKAFIDRQGRAIPSSRVAVRPRRSEVSIDVLWALCNSPIANAFIFSHTGKRDIAVGVLGKMPVPLLSKPFCSEVEKLAQTLFAESRKEKQDETKLRELWRRLDVTVLGAYGLFAPAEQRVLSLFEGQPRLGLSFEVSSAGKKSRLPQYLEEPDAKLEFATETKAGDFVLREDLDAEIEDGYTELAELRRRINSGDPRVAERMNYVRNTLKMLEQHAADRWIPDPQPTHQQ